MTIFGHKDMPSSCMQMQLTQSCIMYHVSIVFMHIQRCLWLWSATSVIWKMNELLGGTKVKTCPGSGEIGMFVYNFMFVITRNGCVYPGVYEPPAFD